MGVSGWHQSLVDYANKIFEIFNKLFAVLHRVLPENRVAANKYLVDVYKPVWTLRSSLNQCLTNNALQTRFQSYVDAEESRLRDNLEAVRYDIDAMDTLLLVTGAVRIEKVGVP